MILFGDPGDEQPRAWLDESMRYAKAEIEATPAQLRREPGDTKANAEPFAQQPARDPLRPVAGTVLEGETLALFDDARRFLIAFPERYKGDYEVNPEVNPTDRLYRCRVSGYALADMAERRKLEAEIERLRGLLAESSEAIRALYAWAETQDWTHEEEQVVNEVTREMAADAGEPDMVGMPIYGTVRVTWNLAESGEPWAALREDNEAVRRALGEIGGEG